MVSTSSSINVNQVISHVLKHLSRWKKKVFGHQPSSRLTTIRTNNSIQNPLMLIQKGVSKIAPSSNNLFQKTFQDENYWRMMKKNMKRSHQKLYYYFLKQKMIKTNELIKWNQTQKKTKDNLWKTNFRIIFVSDWRLKEIIWRKLFRNYVHLFSKQNKNKP